MYSLKDMSLETIRNMTQEQKDHFREVLSLRYSFNKLMDRPVNHDLLDTVILALDGKQSPKKPSRNGKCITLKSGGN